MITAIAEEQETAQATATEGTPKRARKATGGARRTDVAPSKAKSAKRPSPSKKGAKAPKKAGRAKAAKSAGAREGSKTAKVLDLLKRAGGVTLAELMKATGWQPHSVRGFLSGAVGKKMGLKLTSTKGEDGRSYSVA